MSDRPTALVLATLDRQLGLVRQDGHGPVVVEVVRIYYWERLARVMSFEAAASVGVERTMLKHRLHRLYHWQALVEVYAD